MIFSQERLTFFRQSGWMMIAVTLGGLFMMAVHVPATRLMTSAEYDVFGTFLQILNLMLIPALGLQTVFSQQTARVTRPEDERLLAATVRVVSLWVFIIWLLFALVTAGLQPYLVKTLKITNVWGLWLTVFTGLPMLWMPIAQGVLQGRQNFLWLGFTSITNGCGRFLAVLALLLLLHGMASAAMAAACFGMFVGLAIAASQTRDVWAATGTGFDGRAWIKQIIPLTLALGSSQFLGSADMIMVQSFFASTKGYTAAGTVGRGLVLFTGPIALVMFPKIVRSAVRLEKTNVLAQTLVATAVIGAGAAFFCTLFPGIFVWLMKNKEQVSLAPLIPWFTWCVIPLTLSNVLITNLIARSDFRAVPWLALVAASYGVTLFAFGSHRSGDDFADLKRVIQILGLFGVILLAVLCWFTFLTGKRSRAAG